MKVLMVSKALIVGAYQRKAEEMAQLGVDLTVLIPTHWKDRRGDLQAEVIYDKGYQLRPISIRFSGRYHIHYYPSLKREIERSRPDLIYMDEEPYNLATWQGLAAAFSFGIPGIFFTWQNLLRRYPPPFRWLESQNYRRAALAIAGNQAASSVLRKKGFAGPVKIVPQFGVDTILFSPSTAPRRNDTRLLIGYAGGLLPEKGIADLLHACSRLKRPWYLRIIGEGSEKANLMRLASDLKVNEKVSIEARLPAHQMPSFYQTIDVLVLPSRTQTNWQEQFGRVLIEAMSCQVAVIGSNSGEIPNIIGSAGLVYQEGDTMALAGCLQRLSDCRRELDEFALAGRERALQHFTMKQIALRTVQACQCV